MFLKKDKCHSKQKGFSLIELAVVLAIMGLLGLAVLSDSDENSAAAEATKEVSATVLSISKIKSFFGGNFAELDNTVALEAPLVVKRMIHNGAIVNTFKQSITLNPANIDGIADLGFTWTTRVPEHVCAQYVARLEPKVAIVTVNATEVLSLNGVLDRKATASTCNGSTMADITLTIY